MARAMLVVAMALASSLSGRTLEHVSPQFDVQVDVEPACRRGEAVADCTRRIVVDVRRPRGGARLQRLSGPFPEPSRDVPADARLRVADVDFDGHDDIALCTGRDALAGAPSYTVYRYRPARRRFEVDRRLSALQARSSGFFVVDATHRRLRLDAHGGSGRMLTEYGWMGPRLLRLRETVVDASDGRRVRLTAGERRYGHWHARHWAVPLDAPWPRAFEAADAALRRGD